MEAYGGACACPNCPETNPAFLSVDHVNGVPDHHRWPSGRRVDGWELYRRIRQEGYPPDYRILCLNCNIGRAHNGGICPHEGVTIRNALREGDGPIYGTSRQRATR